MIELAGALAELGVRFVTDQTGDLHTARETDLPAILLGKPLTLTTAPIEIRLSVTPDAVAWETTNTDAAERLETIT